MPCISKEFKFSFRKGDITVDCRHCLSLHAWLKTSLSLSFTSAWKILPIHSAINCNPPQCCCYWYIIEPFSDSLWRRGFGYIGLCTLRKNSVLTLEGHKCINYFILNSNTKGNHFNKTDFSSTLPTLQEKHLLTLPRLFNKSQFISKNNIQTKWLCDFW